MSVQSTEVRITFPFGEEQVFRYRAMEDILELLVRNPFRAFTVRRLRELTDNGMKTTSRAVALLTQLDLVCVDSDGRSKDVRLNRDRVTIPDDPLFAIPQDEFRPPLREFVARAREEISDLSALVVFGSVARGEADRRSDIDIWILVDETDRLLEARRTATGIANDLEDEVFPPARRRSSERQSPDGDRYEFEVFAESAETAASYDADLQEILIEGIPLIDSEELQEVKEHVLEGQAVDPSA